MNHAAPISTFTIHDIELDLGTVEFAIRRIKTLSTSVLRSALIRHRADFYRIIWVTGSPGEAKAWIDLDSYPLRPPMMLFVSPGQVRAAEIPAWQTAGLGTGYVIGFTQGFFSDSLDDANALIQLPYFRGVGAAPVLYPNEEQAHLFTEVCCRSGSFERMAQEMSEFMREWSESRVSIRQRKHANQGKDAMKTDKRGGRTLWLRQNASSS